MHVMHTHKVTPMRGLYEQGLLLLLSPSHSMCVLFSVSALFHFYSHKFANACVCLYVFVLPIRAATNNIAKAVNRSVAMHDNSRSRSTINQTHVCLCICVDMYA